MVSTSHPIMSTLASILSGIGRTRTSPSGITGEAPSVSTANDNIAAYPPVDPGIPFLPIDRILSHHEDLLQRIRLSYGCDQETFESELLLLIERYAAYVHLLPATPDNYFSGAGGLLRMGLEVAFFALQATDGQIFSGRTTITKRRDLEPRWRHATFIAGLCGEIHRTLSHVIVTDEKGNEWAPYLAPLAEWMHANHVSRFFLRWVPNAAETRSLGLFALPKIIPPSLLHYLAQGNTVVVPHLMASISGMPVYRERNILDDLVKRSAALVIDRDLRSSADRYGKPQLGSHLERYLVDAMRRLTAADAAWLPNALKSRVWYSEDGLFVVWPNAATDICRLLEADRLPGIPKAPDTIVEILVAAEVIEPRSESAVTWTVYPPTSNQGIEAVKLSSPTIVLSALERAPDPLAIDLTKPRSASASDSAAARHTDAPSVTESQEPPDRPGQSKRSKSSHMGKADADSEAALAASPQMTLPISMPAVDSTPASGTETMALDSPPQGGTPQPIPQSPRSSAARPHHPHGLNAARAHDIRTTAQVQQPVADASPAFALNAPMRLNPQVRAALAEIVATLNGPGARQAGWSTAYGLFVPLSEFEQRKLDTSLVIRALAEMSMLIPPATGPAKTIVRNFGGEDVFGIVIRPQCISGFDPADFRDSPAMGRSGHAGP